MWFSSASIFTVTSFGAGPGLNFDFALFIFHVPDCSSAAAMETLTANATSSMAAIAKAKDLVRIISISEVGWGWIVSFLIGPCGQNVQLFLFLARRALDALFLYSIPSRRKRACRLREPCTTRRISTPRV